MYSPLPSVRAMKRRQPAVISTASLNPGDRSAQPGYLGQVILERKRYSILNLALSRPALMHIHKPVARSRSPHFDQGVFTAWRAACAPRIATEGERGRPRLRQAGAKCAHERRWGARRACPAQVLACANERKAIKPNKRPAVCTPNPLRLAADTILRLSPPWAKTIEGKM
ncbi:hypothetical protein HPB48_003670 [Haemaphysalis longicornis]|uniref:Uncharacterized protein n=1 Tax=Haemaphysalis longicornis TaxID=44386 RepID=A0A9J6FHU2_HAELO|nr:hypothetical protein HPB48_003670 [Haemaphysalis longicornis]